MKKELVLAFVLAAGFLWAGPSAAQQPPQYPVDQNKIAVGANGVRLVPIAVRRIGQQVIGSSRVAFEVESGADLPAVLVDRLQVELVLRNLIANALEALRGGDGRIRVSPADVKLACEYLENQAMAALPRFGGEDAA